MNILAELRYLIGSSRRKNGIYDKKTLEHLRVAYTLKDKTSFLVAYSRLLRDMSGEIPTNILSKLESELNKDITVGQKTRILAFLQESSDKEKALNKKSNVETPTQSSYTLEDFQEQQENWRTALIQHLEKSTIAVVGNSSTLKNTESGNKIDTYDIVCRFNQYPTNTNIQNDIGKKVDIWITSAEVLDKNLTPPANLRWIILTGGDARYTLVNNNCSKYLQQGIQVITLPLSTWSTIVQVIKAPPSAGLLWLSYLAKNINTTQPIQTFGFDSALGNTKQYHIGSSAYRPSKRHAWAREKNALENLELNGAINLNTPKRYAVFTKRLAKNLLLQKHLRSNIILFRPSKVESIDYVAGWGRKQNTEQAKTYALQYKLPYISLEDGFIHSMSQGRLGASSWSLVVDKSGIFYDANKASDLESLINKIELTPKQANRAKYCINTITKHHITKYNNAPLFTTTALKSYQRPVLVLDQVEGDMSIPYAMASLQSFQDMLDTALRENPNSDILIKRHPDVINGKRKGCITLPKVLPHNIHFITDNINPLVLMKHVSKVYVVSSQAGFEALMLGKEVICFGAPFYAGWGLTSDRFNNNPPLINRRRRKPDLYTIFYAAYISYSLYLDPISQRPCEIESILDYVKRQYSQHEKNTGQFICIGLTPWKRRFIKHYLKGPDSKVFFIKSAKEAKPLQLNKLSKLLIWSNKHEGVARELASTSGAQIIKLEDGFLRSVNLGSNYALPSSIVLDGRGIYFDPSKESDLEYLLNNTKFDNAAKKRACLLREKIISLGVCKYNIDNQTSLTLSAHAINRVVILVPGQVADDASIKLGCIDLNTNLGLLEAVRRSNPEAYILYKPHPDVVSDNREGRIERHIALEHCDEIINNLNISSCLDLADEVHTLTSLVGFEALMRQLPVHCYGIPFYSGWGLTYDRHSLNRRRQLLSIDELVAGTLIQYPRYFDWSSNSFINAEDVVDKLHAQRQSLENRKKHQVHTQRLLAFMNLFRALVTPYNK